MQYFDNKSSLGSHCALGTIPGFVGDLKTYEVISAVKGLTTQWKGGNYSRRLMRWVVNKQQKRPETKPLLSPSQGSSTSSDARVSFRIKFKLFHLTWKVLLSFILIYLSIFISYFLLSGPKSHRCTHTHKAPPHFLKYLLQEFSRFPLSEWRTNVV